MSDILKKVELIEKKVQKLIGLCENKNAEIEKLRLECQKLQSALNDKNNELKSIQNKEKITKIVHSIADNPQRNTELKLLINEHIREIDKCIAHLNQ